MKSRGCTNIIVRLEKRDKYNCTIGSVLCMMQIDQYLFNSNSLIQSSGCNNVLNYSWRLNNYNILLFRVPSKYYQEKNHIWFCSRSHHKSNSTTINKFLKLSITFVLPNANICWGWKVYRIWENNRDWKRIEYWMKTIWLFTKMRRIYIQVMCSYFQSKLKF